jgi:hypothetical protein
MDINSKAPWIHDIPFRIYANFPGTFRPRQAKAVAQKIVRKAFALQKKAGTRDLPDAASRLVLSAADPWFSEEYLDYLLAEGVTTQDIESWWDQPDMYRWMDVAFDDWRLSHYFELWLRELWDTEEAWSVVYREQPCFAYGPPVEHRRLKGEHRPLPWELNDRYDAWLQRLIVKDGAVSQDCRELLFWESVKWKTRNALFRAKLKNDEA